MSYTITVTQDGSDAPVVHAVGSLKLISAAAREAVSEIKDSEDDFSALIEVTEDGETRTVAKVAGDADVVSVVVKKKLTKERAAKGVSEDTENAENGGESATPRGRRGRAATPETAPATA